MKLNRNQASNLTWLLKMAQNDVRAMMRLTRIEPEQLILFQDSVNEAEFIIGSLENDLKDTTKTEIEL